MKFIKVCVLLVIGFVFLVACQKEEKSPYQGKWYVVRQDGEQLEMNITNKTITIGDAVYDYEETGHGALADGRPFYTVKDGENAEYTIIFLEEDETVAVMLQPYDIMEKATEGEFLFGMQRKEVPKLDEFLEKYYSDQLQK